MLSVERSISLSRKRPFAPLSNCLGCQVLSMDKIRMRLSPWGRIPRFRSGMVTHPTPCTCGPWAGARFTRQCCPILRPGEDCYATDYAKEPS